jgi:hypothetical protein
MRLRMSRPAVSATAGLLVVVGLLLRLVAALQGDPMAPYFPSGGDTAWYMAMGEGLWAALLHGVEVGVSRAGLQYVNSAYNIPPLYVLFVGFWQQIVPPDWAVIGIRASQCLLSVLTGLLAADAARRLAQSTRAGLVVLAVMMLDPSQILEPRHILTETLYITLVTASVWAYLVWMVDVKAVRPRAALGVGAPLALASLTRAVGIVYPLFLAAHLMWRWRAQWRRAAVAAGLLLATYIALTSIWTVYNVVVWDRFLYLSDQFLPAVWRGATTEDGSPFENDALLLADATPDPDCEGDCTPRITLDLYARQALRFITEDLTGYVSLRLSELGESILQPHAATNLPGESLRALAADWARSGFTWEGLLRLVNGDDFWLKLTIYIFQYAGYGLMLVGLWRLRARWHLAAVPLTFIIYTVAIHVVLLALPRYIFPIMPMVWMLAGAALRPLARSHGESPPAAAPAPPV